MKNKILKIEYKKALNGRWFNLFTFECLWCKKVFSLREGDYKGRKAGLFCTILCSARYRAPRM